MICLCGSCVDDQCSRRRAELPTLFERRQVRAKASRTPTGSLQYHTFNSGLVRRHSDGHGAPDIVEHEEQAGVMAKVDTFKARILKHGQDEFVPKSRL